MEQLQEFWELIKPYIVSTGIGSAILAVVTAVLKSFFTKTINKIDVGKISQQTISETTNKIKEISFTQSIAPLVKSELIGISDLMSCELKSQLKEIQEREALNLDVLAALGAYFDNSIGVNEELKQTFHETLSKAQAKTQKAYEKVQTIIVEGKDEKTATPVKTAVIDR